MDEKIENTAEETSAGASYDVFPEYKRVAYKVSLFTAILFFLRIPADFALGAVYKALNGVVSPDAMYMLRLGISLMFLQILPSVISAAMFGFFGNKGEKLKAMYRVPKNMVKAVGNFPAIYGLGIMINIVTIGVSMLLSPKVDYNEALNPIITKLASPSLGSAWFLFAFAVLMAPIFEEFVFRGTLLNTLKPYGNRLAVFYTGILFGVFHGNFSQCFYAMAVGIALGYIADVTDSLVPTTVIHMLINSIAGCILLLLSTPSIQNYLFSGGNNSDIPDKDMAMITLFAIFSISALLFAAAGAALFFVKLKKRGRYRLPRVCAEISGGRKVKAILLTVPTAIAVLLMIDTYTDFSARLISGLFA